MAGFLCEVGREGNLEPGPIKPTRTGDVLSRVDRSTLNSSLLLTAGSGSRHVFPNHLEPGAYWSGRSPGSGDTGTQALENYMVLFKYRISTWVRLSDPAVMARYPSTLAHLAI